MTTDIQCDLPFQPVGAGASHLEALYLQWAAMPRDSRPDFLTWAHDRRQTEAAR